MEICRIPRKRNPTNTLSRQDKKDVLGRKIAVHNANTDLVRELRVPFGANDSAIQYAFMKLFNAHTRDQTESIAVKAQASKVKRSIEDQALKASDSVRD